LKLADARKDPYRRLAKESNYRSRAVYKLDQLNKSYHFLKHGTKVVDIGAAPGGWLQLASKLVGPDGLVIGIDIKEIEPITNVITITGDITKEESILLLQNTLIGKADLILSDLAPNVSGIWEMDHLKQIDLTRKAVEATIKLLRHNGNAIYKVFQGETTSEFILDMKKLFLDVLITKPDASRKQSSEIYLVCKKFRLKDSQKFDISNHNTIQS